MKTRRWLQPLLLALVIGCVVAAGLHVLVAKTDITWKDIASKVWGSGSVILALWIFGEKKVRDWKKDAEDARLARAKEETDRAALLLKAQAEANEERVHIRQSVGQLGIKVEHVIEQVGTLVKDGQNNDGSTARDRADLLYAEVKALGSLMGSTASIAMWLGILDRQQNLVPIRVSDRFVKLTGMSHEQTRNKGWLNFVAPEDQTRVDEMSDVSLLRGQPMQADYTLINIVTDEPVRVRDYRMPTRNPVTNKIVSWTWEIYELSESNMHMHRRASDAPEGRAA